MAFEYSVDQQGRGWALLLAVAAALLASLLAILLLAAPTADAQESLRVEVTGPDEIHHHASTDEPVRDARHQQVPARCDHGR